MFISQQYSKTEIIDSSVVAHNSEFISASLGQSLDKILGNTAQTEAADKQRRFGLDISHSFFSRVVDLDKSRLVFNHIRRSIQMQLLTIDYLKVNQSS